MFRFGQERVIEVVARRDPPGTFGEGEMDGVRVRDVEAHAAGVADGGSFDEIQEMKALEKGREPRVEAVAAALRAWARGAIDQECAPAEADQFDRGDGAGRSAADDDRVPPLVDVIDIAHAGRV